MTDLFTLTPRQAGPRPIEPGVTFVIAEQNVSGAERCADTCGCQKGTSLCPATGRTVH